MEKGFGKVKQNTPTIEVGDIFPSNKHGKFKVIGYFSQNNIKIEFLETGVIGYTSTGAIRKGSVAPYKPSLG